MKKRRLEKQYNNIAMHAISNFLWHLPWLSIGIIKDTRHVISITKMKQVDDRMESTKRCLTGVEIMNEILMDSLS